MNWKNYFKPWILERGYEYYLENRVNLLEVNDTLILANVKGTEVYSVSIYHDQYGNIEEMECDCPYAETGNYCKHEAAVLYTYFKEENELLAEFDYDVSVHTKIDFNKVKEKINSLTLEECKEYIESLLLNSYELKEQFIERFMKHDETVNILLHQMEQILPDYEGVYLDEEEMFELNDDIFKVINQFDEYLQQGRKKDVLETLYYVCPILLQLENNEYVGLDSTLCNRCLECLEDILKEVSKDEKDKIFKLICKMIIVPYQFRDKQYMKLLKQYFLIDPYLDEIKKIVSLKLKNKYIDNEWILFMGMILKGKEQEEFLYERYSNHKIRILLANHKIEFHHYEDALCILKDGLIFDINNISDLNENIKLMLSVYEELQQKENAIELCKMWLYTYCPGNKEGYLYLKTILKNEWNHIREDVLLTLKEKRIDMIWFYHEECLCDKVYEYLVKRNKFDLLIQYDDILVEDYEKQMLAMYQYFIMEKMKKTKNRNEYYVAIQNVDHMLKYPNGRKSTIQFISFAMKQFRNRPALIDELQKKLDKIN